MKQLRFLFLMLVACVAQVSMAQSSDYVKDQFRQDVRRILFYAKNIDEANKDIKEIMLYDFDNKYAMLKPKAMESTINTWVNTILSNYPKTEKKVNKGKSISIDEALDIALLYATGYKNVFNIDYSKALQYFEMAKGDSCFKSEIEMSIVGCQYMVNKDKVAAADNIFIDSNKIPSLRKIAQKYGLVDIYLEKLKPVLQENNKNIKRAIRSKDWSKLALYSNCDIKEVDSLLAEHLKKDIYKIEENTSSLPSFPGGVKRFIDRNKEYPIEALENGVMGRVVVKAYVEVDGSLSNIRITHAAAPLLNEEALRVVKSMSSIWIPAIKEGKPYRCETEIPVVFRLQ